MRQIHKKPLFIVFIFGLLLFISLLFVVISVNKSSTPLPGETVQEETVKTATLSFSPGSMNASGSSQSAQIVLDTGGSQVTGVQIELVYDPRVLSNVVFSPASGADAFFNKPQTTLFNRTDAEAGTVSYATAFTTSAGPKSGSGVVGTVRFSVRNNSAEKTLISFSQDAAVTAQGSVDTILKESLPLLITLTQQ